MLIGLGRNIVFRYEVGKSRWLKVNENMELVRDTLVYPELVPELCGKGRAPCAWAASTSASCPSRKGMNNAVWVGQISFGQRTILCRGSQISFRVYEELQSNWMLLALREFLKEFFVHFRNLFEFVSLEISLNRWNFPYIFQGVRGVFELRTPWFFERYLILVTGNEQKHFQWIRFGDGAVRRIQCCQHLILGRQFIKLANGFDWPLVAVLRTYW